MPMDKLSAIHYRQTQDVKKFKKKIYQIEERNKLQQIAFEEEINQKKIDALKNYLANLEIKRLILKDIEMQKTMQENAEKMLNII